jgi:hypothetical protein
VRAGARIGLSSVAIIRFETSEVVTAMGVAGQCTPARIPLPSPLAPS